MTTPKKPDVEETIEQWTKVDGSKVHAEGNWIEITLSDGHKVRFARPSGPGTFNWKPREGYGDLETFGYELPTDAPKRKMKVGSAPQPWQDLVEGTSGVTATGFEVSPGVVVEGTPAPAYGWKIRHAAWNGTNLYNVSFWPPQP